MPSPEKGRSAQRSIPAAQPPAVGLPFPAFGQGRPLPAGMPAARECPICPAWVKRCAHWEGLVLHIVDLAKHLELCEGRSSPHGTAWAVYHGEPIANGHLRLQGEGFRTDDLPAAEAEFFRREALLLGRDE